MVPRADSQDGVRWRCRCGKTRSIRDGSFFEKSNLSLGKIVLLVYCWSVDTCMTATSVMVGVSESTVIDWFNMLRGECHSKLLQLPMDNRMLGGQDQIVEIDESVMIKRKYSRGAARPHQDHWVFGMYDRQRKVGVIELVDRQDSPTLEQLIQRYIRPGSIIYSNGLAAYNGLGALGYSHEVVIHADVVVDPNTGVHTKGVEAYCSRAKSKLKACNGSVSEMVPSYFDEFMWREHYGQDHVEAFKNIRLHLAEHYH